MGIERLFLSSNQILANGLSEQKRKRPGKKQVEKKNFIKKTKVFKIKVDSNGHGNFPRKVWSKAIKGTSIP